METKSLRHWDEHMADDWNIVSSLRSGHTVNRPSHWVNEAQKLSSTKYARQAYTHTQKKGGDARESKVEVLSS